jgi:hypothetical protein
VIEDAPLGNGLGGSGEGKAGLACANLTGLTATDLESSVFWPGFALSRGAELAAALVEFGATSWATTVWLAVKATTQTMKGKKAGRNIMRSRL